MTSRDSFLCLIAAEAHDGLQRLLAVVEDAASIGWLLGEQGIAFPADIGLPAALGSSAKGRLDCTQSYIACGFHYEERGFIDGLSVSGWQPSHIAGVARSLPFRADVRRWLAQFGPAVEGEYRRRVRGFLQDGHLDSVQIACRGLVAAGRPIAAVDVLFSPALQKVTLSPDLIAEILDATYQSPSIEDQEVVRQA